MKCVEQIKYIVETSKRVLCMKGFVLKSNFDNHTIRLFSSKKLANDYMQNGTYSNNLKYNIKKVIIKLVVMEDEEQV